MRLPEPSVSLPDITLSDERGQENARGPADLARIRGFSDWAVVRAYRNIMDGR